MGLLSFGGLCSSFTVFSRQNRTFYLKNVMFCFDVQMRSAQCSSPRALQGLGLDKLSSAPRSHPETSLSLLLAGILSE